MTCEEDQKVFEVFLKNRELNEVVVKRRRMRYEVVPMAQRREKMKSNLSLAVRRTLGIPSRTVSVVCVCWGRGLRLLERRQRW